MVRIASEKGVCNRLDQQLCGKRFPYAVIITFFTDRVNLAYAYFVCDGSQCAGTVCLRYSMPKREHLRTVGRGVRLPVSQKCV